MASAGVRFSGFFASFLLEASFEARTTRVQLVRREEGRWATVGSPMDLVDVSPTSVVEPGRDGIAALVDADRLEQPVLQAKSIRQFAWLARIGCLLAAIGTFFGFRALDRFGIPPPDAIEA